MLAWRSIRAPSSLLAVALAAPSCALIAGLGDYQHGAGGGGTGGAVTSSSASSTSSASSSSSTSSGALDPARLSTGVAHACFVTDEGHLDCWGDNGGGQLGFLSKNEAYFDLGMTVPGTDSVTFTAVAAGAAHTCALAKDGDVWCWGDSSKGAAGPMTVGEPELTAHALAGVKAKQIVAGNEFTCALGEGGTVRCWGDNSRGQLGPQAPGASSAEPITVGVPSASAIATCPACSTTCALAGGSVHCWGGGSDVAKPAAIAGVTSAAAIAVGGNGGSAWEDRVLILDQSGALFASWRGGPGAAFGAPQMIDNSLPVGQIAAGDRLCFLPTPGNSVRCTNPFTTPPTLPVLESPAVAPQVITVSVGYNYKCMQSPSGPQCIGQNNIGQLGDGKSEKVYWPTIAQTNVYKVFHGPHCTTVELGDHTHRAFGECQVYSLGPKLYAEPIDLPGTVDSFRTGPFGDENLDERGYFHDTTAGLYQQTNGQTSAPFASIPTGKSDFSVLIPGSSFDAALDAAQRAHLFKVNDGYNDHSLFADVMGASEYLVPTMQVLGVAASAAAGHVCVWTASEILCWGDNTFGQADPQHVGGDVTKPTTVAGIAGTIGAVAVGRDFTCALIGGEAYCWGNNDQAQLGLLGAAPGVRKVQIPANPIPLAHLACGNDFACAAGGKLPDVFCWGNNDFGATGQTVLGPQTPRAVNGLKGGTAKIAALVAGSGSICMLEAEGSRALYCWGQSTRGEVGFGQAIERSDKWAAVSLH